jgi:hypothetical protein
LFRISVGLTWLTLLAASPALAQNGGLFGATRPIEPDRFDFLFDVSEGYESELPPEFRQQVSRNELESGGFSTLFVPSFEYAHNGRRLQLGASAATALKYYHRLDRFSAVSTTAGAGGTVVLPRRFELRANQTVAYAPSYLYGLFPTEALLTPGEALVADPDYRTDEAGSYSFATNVNLGHTSRGGTRIAGSGDFRHTKFDRQTITRFDSSFYAFGATVTRPLSRNVNLTGEYQYRTAEFRANELTREHSGTVGVNYSRPLSRSRRVTYRFDLSPASLEVPQSALNEIALRENLVGVELDDKIFRMQFEGGIDYDFRLNWKVTGYYRRGVEYLAVLTEPIFADGAKLALVGLITRRLDLTSTAGYAKGESSLYGGGEQLRTYTGNARLRFAINRPWAVYSEYLYYQYDLRGQTRIAPDLPNVYKQHVIRFGVMFFASLDR